MSTQLDMTIRVNVELSENTKKFLKELLCSFTCQPGIPGNLSDDDAVKNTAQSKSQPKRKKANSTEATAEPAPNSETVPEPKADPEPERESASASTVSIKDLREELMRKVDKSREAIKDKLSELGSPSITKLDEKYYDEFYKFLKSL